MTDEPIPPPDPVTPAPVPAPTTPETTPEPTAETTAETTLEPTPETTAETTPKTTAETKPVVTPETKPAPPAPFVWGTGRRKAAVARVRIRPGEGKFLINKREVDAFFCIPRDRASVRQPLEVTETSKAYDVFVNVGGGGITGQAGAVALGVARALAKSNSDYEPKLREFNLLTRDPRKVERKKYGRRGARRRFQFSKR